MRFGKIEYLNLVIFDVFAKQYNASTNFKAILNQKKSYPSKLNKEFLFNRIDAGFISSIAGMKSHITKHVCNAGIIASKEVWSALILNMKDSSDYQSATSNALCKVLNKKGKVIIGDGALKTYYAYKSGTLKKDFLDMASLWYDRYRLPFVFGRMCFNDNARFYKNIIKQFCIKLGRNNKKYKGIKVPHYILMEYVKKLDIDKSFAIEYLKHIYYCMGKKEHISLERFYRCLRLKHLRAPKRF